MRLSARLLRVQAVLLLCLLMSLCGYPCAIARAAVANVQRVSDNPDAELKDFDLVRLQEQLRTMPPGAERNYFAGVLANREGRPADSIRLLEKALPKIRATDSARAIIALQSLADDFTKTFRYREADSVYEDLLSHFATQMDPQELLATQHSAGEVHILRDAPPQTIDLRGPVRLKIKRNPIGFWVARLKVNSVSGPWLLDTGANMSLVSRSFARRLGLKPLPGEAEGRGGTGIETPEQIALLPSLSIGGATLHNVVVLILDDADLNLRLGRLHYQIEADLGYPVLRALGAITFYQDGRFEAGAATRANTTDTRMFMHVMMPVIECGVEGEELPFSFDTGAFGAQLSMRYYQRFRGESRSWKKATNTDWGVGGVVKRKIYIQPNLELTVGAAKTTLAHVPIFPEHLNASASDDTYGTLGPSFAKGFASFTIDFNTMTFSLGPALHKP